MSGRSPRRRLRFREKSTSTGSNLFDSMGALGSVPSRKSLPGAARDSSCLESFDRELDYLFGLLQRFGAHPNDVEDFLQEIFVVLYRNWPSLDIARPLRPWLFGVTLRVLRTHRRRRPREAPQEDLDPQDDALDPEALLQTRQSLAILSAALERVPAKRRQAVVLHDLEGVAVADVARRLSITKCGVYARLYKGRKELAKAVQKLRVTPRPRAPVEGRSAQAASVA